MKRIFCLILCLILLLLAVGCSVNNEIQKAAVKRKTEEKESKEITVIMPFNSLEKDANYNGLNFLRLYGKKFTRETGIKVNLETIEASNYDDFIKKRNLKLYSKEGAELILIGHRTEYGGHWDSYRELVKSGVALKVSDKIENHKNLYEGLKNDYFIPVAIAHYTTPIKRDVLEKIGVDKPDIDWTFEDYKNIWLKWIQKETVHLNRNSYYELAEIIFYDIKLSDDKIGKVDLNREEVVEAIKKLREEIYSGKFIVDKNYTYRNFYNMLFVPESEEYKKGLELAREFMEKSFYSNYYNYMYNVLNTFDSRRGFHSDKLILPELRKIYFGDLFAYGFIVNKNGKNVKEALDFLNFLLSDAIQLSIYKNDGQIPRSISGNVVKTIENKIEEIEEENVIPKEAIRLRKYMYQKIDKSKDVSEVLGRYNDDRKRLYVVRKFHEEVAKIVFADKPYTDEEIRQTLQKLEDELNIYITE